MSGWHCRRMLNSIGGARPRTFFKLTDIDSGVILIAFVSETFFALKNTSN